MAVFVVCKSPPKAISVKRIYLEPSVINHAVTESYVGSFVRQAFEQHGYTPVLGLHVIYELARTFLNPSDVERGKCLFNFVQDLDLLYSPGPSNLLKQEVIKLRTGAAVLPFLSHYDQVATRTEVIRLANGTFDERACRFISGREQDVHTNYPAGAQNYISHVNTVRTEDPSKAPKFRTFEEVRRFFEPQIPFLIHDLLKPTVVVTQEEANELSMRLNAFLALRSTVNANLYLTFICIGQGVVPAFDKLDDYRHLIEASYCEGMVTGDGQLKRTGPRINPELRILEFSDLL